MTDLEGDLAVNLKNNPERNVELREMYSVIKPGYHMNKKHWNTIELNEYIPDSMVFQLIDESYEIVVSGLTRKQKEALSLI